jgi:hypothetical protein
MKNDQLSIFRKVVYTWMAYLLSMQTKAQNITVLNESNGAIKDFHHHGR